MKPSRIPANQTRVAVVVALFPLLVHGYEIDTHAHLSVASYAESNLAKNAAVLQNLGLLKSRPMSVDSGGVFDLRLGENYFDLGTTPPNKRTKTQYDEVSLVASRIVGAITDRWPITRLQGGRVPYFPVDWMARGAVREDDAATLMATLETVFGDRNAPDMLDANPKINRFCNHFYDPINNGKLELGGSPLALFACGPSEVFSTGVQWATGATNPDGSGAVSAQRINSFSVVDAREAMWRALTGTDNQGAVVAGLRSDRDAYWATTFRALGDVVHLLQDLGQPQHTRNEAHPSFLEAGLLESRTNARALGVPESKPGANGSIVKEAPPALVYGPSPYGTSAPSFARYRDFFSTHSGASSYVGKGLANYSNRGFFTSAANFGTDKYAQPAGNAVNYQTVVDINPADGTYATYLSGLVPDNLGGAPASIWMTRESLLKDVIDVNGLPAVLTDRRYVIDRKVVDAQANLLIPRAVAYSTGLINFFFRGGLSVEPTTDGVFGVLDHATDVAFKKLVVKVRNTTSAVLDSVTGGMVPQPMTGGKFVAVVRYHRDWAFQNDLSAGIGIGACDNLAAIYRAGNEPGVPGHDPTKSTVCRDGDETLMFSSPIMASLDPDEEKEMPFDFTAHPVSLAGTDYSLQVIYRGPLGYEDDAVVSGYRDLMDPIFVTRHNAYDYVATDYFTDGTLGFFGGTISYYMGTMRGIPPPYNPVAFLPANKPLAASQQSLKAMGRTCWSLAALQQFPCYDESKPMTYWFTFGSRANEQIAAATDVAPGRFTRIALLAPLDLPERPVTLPPLLVERQRSATEPFMGEALILPKRHARYDVKWPSPMRGVNSWHSDGYAWATQQPQSILGGWHYGRHCLLAPSADVSAAEPGVSTNDPPVTVTVTTYGTVEFSPQQRTLVNCQLAWGQLLTNLAPSLHKFNWSGFSSYGLGAGVDPNNLRSSFSAWDVYVGTSPYALEETYPAPATAMGDHVMTQLYTKDRALDLHGVTNSQVSGLPPVPVTIAEKYR